MKFNFNQKAYERRNFGSLLMRRVNERSEVKSEHKERTIMISILSDLLLVLPL